MYIERINSSYDLKKLNIEELKILAQEMRQLLIKKTSLTGGHLASNLCIVEISIGLHYIFDTPTDKIVFDVPHQTYCHKMLTGRNYAFIDVEKFDSISGYTNPNESEYDLFNIGHTSTSISLALGIAKARDLKGGHEDVIAVIGDASLDGGQAFEALNYAVEQKSGLIVVVNDNNMSIPENHGALNMRLNELRSNHGQIENNFFKSLGFDYEFVQNGNDLVEVISALRKIRKTTKPVVVHMCTQKGKGYEYAENDSEKFHWARPFNIATGEFLSNVPTENYGAICRDFLLEKMKNDKEVIVIAASTPLCIGFSRKYREIAGEQFVDVGIAEQNAVSYATGIAKNGGKPIFATNSTFFQRVYDQIEQEMCIGKIPVTMIVTHGSVLGHTNDTHAGLFDIALLSHIPYLVYLAPTNKEEYIAMLNWSIDQKECPVAIRVPWLGVRHASHKVDNEYSETKYLITQHGTKVAFLALGGFYHLGLEAAHLYEMKTGIKPTLINPRYITGIDKVTLSNLIKEHNLIVTIEDGIISGGFGSKITQYYSLTNTRVINFGFQMETPNCYNGKEYMEINHLTPEHIVEDIIKNEIH